MKGYCESSCGRCGGSTPGTTSLFRHRGKDLFLVGVNLGNVQFIPFRSNPYGYSEQEIKSILRQAFQDLSKAGANSVRFWLHIDGSSNPAWAVDSVTGKAMVSGLPNGFTNDLKWLLKTAFQEYRILVNVCLWSHDVLAVRRDNGDGNRQRAIRMMTDDRATNKYIQNALVPMMNALKDPMGANGDNYLAAISSIEILNEPEGVSWHWRLYLNYQYKMRYGSYSWWNKDSVRYLNNRSRTEYAVITPTGVKYKGWHFVTENGKFNGYVYKDVTDPYPSEWAYLKGAIVENNKLETMEIPYNNVLRFVNKVAGAIKRTTPGVLVSCGAHSIPYNTDISMNGLNYPNAPRNYYSDASLMAAGGDSQGKLDFYQVHGYPIWEDEQKDKLINMFRLPKSHWKLGKRLVVGEHWDQVYPGGAKITPKEYVWLHDSGYAGVWGWAWFNVSESYDSKTDRAKRSIRKHSNQDAFRNLMKNLPARILYKP